MQTSTYLTAKKSFRKSIFQSLLKPVDNNPLIAFRIVFGFLLFYHSFSAVLNGTVYKNFIQPPFTFTFIGFEFLHPLPGNGMYFYFGLMAFMGILIMLGAWYRLAMWGFAFLWTLIYLMQKSGYNNHYYLLVLLCWIMAFLPANNRCSIDVKRKAVTETTSCSRYYVLIFTMQVAIIYFYAAVSKISSDWFSGKYLAIQFSGLTTRHFTGFLYGTKWFQLLICYGGFFFDLLIVPLLLIRKTRNFAFILSCLFHLFNSYTFSIGIFPYLSIALNIFFLDQWTINRYFFRRNDNSRPPTYTSANCRPGSRLLIVCFGIYFCFQLLLPLRSWMFPGDVFWTEEGYRMSWKMMMRTKSGTVFFRVSDPATHQQWKIEPAKAFAPAQMLWLSASPDIIWQYAQRLKKEFTVKGFPEVQVYAIGAVSLNRNTYRPMIDTTVDLAHVRWQPFKHSAWITPYNKNGD